MITSFGFEINIVEDCMYHKFSGSKYIFLVLYIDDILLAINNICLLHDTKRFLSNLFEMKDLGDVSFVLRIHIHLVHSRDLLGLSQRSFIDKVRKSFGMQDANHMTPRSLKETSSVSIMPKE